jgi:Putative Ig domain/Carboxypeptidase regulatory-like domain
MKRFFSTISAIIFCTIITFSIANGQIAAWDFTGNNAANATFAATGFDSKLVSAAGASDITRGATASAVASNNSFSTAGFQNNGISTSNTDYFQVTLRPTAGNLLSIASINARLAGTDTFAAAPGVTTQFAYSLNGTTFTLIQAPQVKIGSPQTLDEIGTTGIAALQNVPSTTTVTIRLYVSGQTTTGAWGLISPIPGRPGLSIDGYITPLDITTPNILTVGYLSVFYTKALATIGGTAPYTYSLAGGSLPPGLMLNSNGTISGMPNTPGAYPFDVLVTDSAGNFKRESFDLSIKAPTAASASVRGRVVNEFGRPLSRASVSVLNAQTGEIRFASTNFMGYFNFTDLTVGDFYIVQTQRKGYQFDSNNFQLFENLDSLTITGFTNQ